MASRSQHDFDADVQSDLLFRNQQTGENGMWLMNGFTVRAAQAIPSAGIGWIIAGTGDFNGDVAADILWHNPTTGENGIWLMNGFTILDAEAFHPNNR